MQAPITTGIALPQFPRDAITVQVPTLEEIAYRLLGPGRSGLRLNDLADVCRGRAQRSDMPPEIARQYGHAADSLELSRRLSADSSEQHGTLDDHSCKELYVMAELYLVIALAYIRQAGEKHLAMLAAAENDDERTGTG